MFFLKIGQSKKLNKTKINIKTLKENQKFKLENIEEIFDALSKKFIKLNFINSIILSIYKIGITLNTPEKIQRINLFLFNFCSLKLEKVYPQKTIGIKLIKMIKIISSITLKLLFFPSLQGRG